MTDSVQYPSTPDAESWVIPFWDYRDVDEFEDLLIGVRTGGPERFGDATRTFQRAMKTSSIDGVRFYVGADLLDTTLVLRPDTRSQAVGVLTRILWALSITPRGIAPWERVSAHLEAIKDLVESNSNSEIPSFGFGVLVPTDHEGQYTEAPTSWIGND